jgi:hypothetical protein
MSRFLISIKAVAALVDRVRTAPGCSGDCSGGRRPCNCRPQIANTSAPEAGQSAPRCIACGRLQGEPHAGGCRVARFTIRRAQ